MRNLVIRTEQAAALPDGFRLLGAEAGAAGRSPSASFCIDTTEGRVYAVAADSSNSAHLLALESGALADAIPLPFAAMGSTVTSVQFMVERDVVVLALASGDIYTVT
ncbi:hypothetical protein IWQ57_003700, partial [Coemansia nantahalensis]